MKIPIPTPAENPVTEDAKFDAALQDLFQRIGAKATYSRMEEGRRVDYVLVDVEPGKITPTAEPVFHFLHVKPEFLPEVTPTPYYGRSGY